MPTSTVLTYSAALLQEQQDAQSETSRQMNAFEVCCICPAGCACLPTLGVQVAALMHMNTAVIISCGLVTCTRFRFQNHMCFVEPNSMLLLQLINAALDISAIFEAREDVVSRHTRFTSKASVAALMTGIEAAAARLGATSQQRGPTKCASWFTCMSCLCQG